MSRRIFRARLHFKSQWLLGAAIGAASLVAAALAWKTALAARALRRQIQRSERVELASFWRTVDDLRVHARVSKIALNASAPPVVLVHGFGISSSYFVPTAELLASKVSVYAPDLPGHGRSDTPPRPLDVPRLADALVRWMDAAGVGRASLVGNSLGCQIAVDAAVRYPERVDRLVLIGPTMDPAGRSLWKVIPRFMLGGLYERWTLTWPVLKDYSRMGLRLLPELRYLLRDRIEDKFPNVKCPTMLVRGENDSLVPQRWFEQAARLVRAERVAIIPGWGHAVNYSAAEALVDAILPFLLRQSLAIQRETGTSSLNPRPAAACQEVVTSTRINPTDISQ